MPLDTWKFLAWSCVRGVVGGVVWMRPLPFLQASIHTKANPWNPNGLKKESVLEQAATSLASLQTSCVDIFYLHAPDHNTPIEETLAACQQLYQGRVTLCDASINTWCSQVNYLLCIVSCLSKEGKFKETALYYNMGLSNLFAEVKSSLSKVWYRSM